MNEEAQVETEVESTETEVPPTPASESVEEVKAERPDWLPQNLKVQNSYLLLMVN